MPRLPPCELDEFRAYVSGLSTPQKIISWRKRWYHAPPDLRNYVRTLFHHDKEVYYQAFRPDDEDMELILEEGMKGFGKLIRRLNSMARSACLRPLYLSGQSMTEQFVADLAHTANLTHILSDFVFVSIDFEGGAEHKGINEAGIATLDSRDIFAGTGSDRLNILNKNFAVQRFQRNRHFMFGQTTRTDNEKLSQKISNELEIRTSEGVPRKILLVGHGVRSDIDIMESLGLHVEDLVAGIIDTHQIAETQGIRPGSLQSLLALRCVPHSMSSLHCAGNDAHYALQLLLSLLCETHMIPSGLGLPPKLMRMHEVSIREGPQRVRDKHLSTNDESQTDLGKVTFLAHDQDEGVLQCTPEVLE